MTAQEAPVTDAASSEDVVDVLTTDHREALTLIDQILSSTDHQQRREMADAVIAELVRHSVAEEMFVYPAMRKHLPDGEAAVEHDTQEHKQLERQMKQLESLPATEPGFDEQVRALQATLRDHVDDEESEQFPQLRAALSHEDLVAMAGKVATAKRLAPTRPHPDAPNNQLFHKTLGPGVGLVDRLRDALSGRSA